MLTNPMPAASPGAQAQGDADLLIQTPSGAKVHALIVDDNDGARKMLAAMCELFDCSSFLAKDGVEAVEAFCSMSFDVILMDIDMPRMDGLAAARAIRAGSWRGRRVPIIAVTASVDPSEIRTYLDAGMNDLMSKPIEASRVLETISAAVGTSPRRRHPWIAPSHDART
jgi:two-component system, sensor histidine kinase